MSIIRGRIVQDEWTKCGKDGKPVCGVGRRGFWTNTVTVGGPSPFKECPCCGEWVPKDTGEHGVVKSYTMSELMAIHNLETKCPNKKE